MLFHKVIRTVFSGRALKKQFLAEELPGPGRESSREFPVPEAFVLSLLDSLQLAGCQLHTVQNTK